MIESILDTDTLSEVLGGVNSRVVARAAQYVGQFGVLTFSTVTVYEILTGFEQKQAHARLKRAEAAFARNREILPEREDYLLAARILGHLRRTGREIGYSDPLIAAVAIRRGLTLVTGNQRHFQFIKDAGFGLELDDWRTA